MKYFKFGSKGQSLVELLVVMALLAIILPALLLGFLNSREGKAQQKQRIDATLLLKEGQEALRNVREKGFSNININGTYYPVVLGDSSWGLSPGSENKGEFTRKIEISDTKRDANGNIAENGTIDPSTKKSIIIVSWNKPYPSSVSSTTYLTRYLGNITFTETTDADFNKDGAVKDGIIILNSQGGEIGLPSRGTGLWCTPNLITSTLDLPKNGVANAISAIEGEVFTGTGENASGVSFADVNIENTNPPSASIIGTMNGYKTNDLFGEDNYVYIATDNNQKEIVIIDISSLPFSEVGYFNAPGNNHGNSVVISGNVGYTTTDNKLYSFDVSGKSEQRGILDADGVTLSEDGQKIAIVGNYAYIATEGSRQLEIVDIGNPANLNVVGYASVDGSEGVDLFVNQAGTRAYLVTTSSDSKNELFIIDVSEKNGSRPTLGSYNTNGMNPKGVTVVPGNAAIIVGLNGEEYQVVNILNEQNPQRCAGTNLDVGINSLASVLESDGDAYSYILARTDPELRMIDGGRYPKEGTFESAIFSSSSPLAFNRFTASIDQPLGTQVKIQVAVSNPLDGNCASSQYEYLGPNGDPLTFFTSTDDSQIQGIIPYNQTANYANPGICFRYKIYFSTEDAFTSAVFKDITVNYSP